MSLNLHTDRNTNLWQEKIIIGYITQNKQQIMYVMIIHAFT